MYISDPIPMNVNRPCSPCQNKCMSLKLKYISTIFLSLSISIGVASGQTYFYFQDSPSAAYYDFSWMEVSAPSQLERLGAESRKFPVETTIIPQQGLNSLRLKWTSNTGGSWVAIAAGLNWTAYDISETDTLLFYLRSEVSFLKELLPKIFMEDVSNKKSNFHLISDWTDDLQAQVWTRVKIPMSQFFDAGDGTNWTSIKTIGFAQNGDDATEHVLYIDDMRVIKGNTSATPASQPSGVFAKGYDSHIEVRWNSNPETDLNGYRIERSSNGGTDYFVKGIVSASETAYIDWIGSSGSQTYTYRVRAINAANEPSDPSESSEAATIEFTDDELLDMVQEYTFRYFWDFGHETSGLTRERNTSGNTVTSGGTGFGLMAIVVGIERGFISREEGADRILTMLNFLENADRFHGAWSHWLHGETGKVIPFSTYDNGGDMVETSFVAQGLLTLRQYFNGGSATEITIVEKATDLWEAIEWDWYRKNDSGSIYWHWSPTYDWQMNMKVSGWNEAAIVYLLAIASPTHGVPASLWESGWAGSSYRNPRTVFGYRLEIGNNYGGPMFFAHYSFQGFDPNNIRDNYVNYFDFNQKHALVQQAYCDANPKKFAGYSEACWGLTASDDPDGYLAHEPNSDRDNGTISPTAALASFPYTPEASMKALKHFYRNLGEKTWGPMGFFDAFNETRQWYADSYLAIDQGPIINMIENYRSQLLWDLFMSNSEIQPMLDAIGFKNSPNSIEENNETAFFSIYPNPSPEGPNVDFELRESEKISLDLYDISGRKLSSPLDDLVMGAGKHHFSLKQQVPGVGIYIIKFKAGENNEIIRKFIVQ